MNRDAESMEALHDLGSHDADERLAATEALAQLISPEAAAWLTFRFSIAFLGETEDEHAERGAAEHRALEVLLERGAAALVWDVLDTAMGSNERELRETAARALMDMNFDFRGVLALRELGTQLEPLIEALSDSDPHVRVTAARALGQLGDLQAVEPLIAALKDEHREWRYRYEESWEQADMGAPVREAAAAALATMGGDVRAVEHSWSPYATSW